MWIRPLKHKLGQIYWKIVKSKNIIAYKIKKYFKRLYIWINGIGKTREQLEIKSDIKTLVICAHPDDETIFFYRTIKRECPYIVCMSHSGNSIRREEFRNAIKVQNVQGIMLNFPDVPGMKWVWKIYMPHVLKRIKKYFPNVEKVYTHSEHGESGHPHHFCVNKSVRQVFDDCKIYSTASKFYPKEEGRLDVAELERKFYIIQNLYPTQVNMLVQHCHWFDDYLHYEVLEETK